MEEHECEARFLSDSYGRRKLIAIDRELTWNRNCMDCGFHRYIYILTVNIEILIFHPICNFYILFNVEFELRNLNKVLEKVLNYCTSLCRINKLNDAVYNFLHISIR